MKAGVLRKPSELKEWVHEEDFYSEDARILLMDDDELTAEESGFMEGYEEED